MEGVGSLADEDGVHYPILPRPAGHPSVSCVCLDDGALGDDVTPDVVEVRAVVRDGLDLRDPGLSCLGIGHAGYIASEEPDLGVAPLVLISFFLVVSTLGSPASLPSSCFCFPRFEISLPPVNFLFELP